MSAYGPQNLGDTSNMMATEINRKWLYTASGSTSKSTTGPVYTEIAEILLPSIGQFQLYIAVYVKILQEWNVGGLLVCWTAAKQQLHPVYWLWKCLSV